MTVTAKEYLSEILKNRICIKQTEDKIMELRARAFSLNSMDYSTEPVQVSKSPGAAFEKQIDAVLKLSTELESYKTVLLEEEIKKIIEIQSLQNIKHIELLYKRYVENKSLERIAAEMQTLDEMPYSYDRIRHMHMEALNAFQDEILNKRIDTL